MTPYQDNPHGCAATLASRLSAPAAAFTLIEMLLVLVLIAALSSLLVANLAGRQDAHALRVATQDLAGALRYAAEQARIRGRCHRLVLLEGASAFRIETADPSQANGFLPVEGPAGRKRNLPGGVHILGVLTQTDDLSELPKSLDFQAGGSGFEGTVKLTNRQGQVTSVEVVSGSSSVVMWEEER